MTLHLGDSPAGLRRMETGWRRIAAAGRPTITALFLICVICVGTLPSLAAADEDESGAIVDLGALDHIRATHELYTDGHNPLLCIETDTGKNMLLNPTDNTLSPFNMPTCPATSTVQLPDRTLHPLNPMVINYASCNSGQTFKFVDGSTICATFDNPSNHCGSNIQLYYTVTFPDGKEDSFYVAARRKEPYEYTMEAWCDAAGGKEHKVLQKFDILWDLSSLDLGDGRALLVAEGGTRPMVIIVSGTPKSVISLSGDIFLIPRSILAPKLDQAGENLQARYQALLAAIGQQSELR